MSTADPGFINIPKETESSYLTNAVAHAPGVSNEQVVSYYNNWDSYDKDLNIECYRGPKIAADFCDILVADKNAKIIDIGAGTGFVGEYLLKHGFTNVDALEPAKGMLDIACKKGIYKNHLLESISRDKCSPSDGTYDALVLAGALGEGHIPSEGVNEFARLVKKDGLIIIVMRKEYLSYVKEYTDRLVPMMDKLENEGIWSSVVRLDVPNYSWNKTGIVFVFRKN